MESPNNGGVSAIQRYQGHFWMLVPVIAIGGMFYPWLGLVMLPMMAAIIALSYSRARYWCNSLCPRGSYMNVVVSRASGFRRVPKALHSNAFRYGFMALFFAVFLFRVYSVASQFQGWELLERLGFVFASVCLVGAIAATILGIAFVPRTWCAFCPMGTLQTEIYKRGRGRGKKE